MKLSSVDLNLLLVFDAIYRERSVTRAGRRLALSQPAVSGALARLRKLFDDPLFVRSPSGMEPTVVADGLAGPLQEILGRMEQLLTSGLHFDPATEDGTLDLALSDYAAAMFLPDLARKVTQEAPLLRLSIHDIADIHGGDTLEKLENGSLDLAVGVFHDVPKRFSVKPMRSDPLVVVLRRDHPCLREGKINQATYLEMNHLSFSFSGDSSLDRIIAKQAGGRRIAMTLPYFAPVARVIAASDMAATVARSVADGFGAADGLTVCELPFTVPDYVGSVIWHQRNDNHGAHRFVREALLAIGERIVPDPGAGPASTSD